MNLSERVKSIVNGAATLLEWTLDGTIIEPEKAQARADICTGRLSGKTCPNNVPDWEFTEQVSDAVRRIVGLKNDLNLKVQGEKQLFACAACGCALRSKVWLELKTILPEPQERVKYWEKCWILSESNE